MSDCHHAIDDVIVDNRFALKHKREGVVRVFESVPDSATAAERRTFFDAPPVQQKRRRPQVSRGAESG